MIDVIVFYETDFQKFIIDYVLEKFYRDRKVLIIHIVGESFVINDEKIHLTLNSTKSILRNAIKLGVIKRLNLNCTDFIGPHITSCNAMYLCSVIKYKNLVMIDDGTATIQFVSKLSGFFFNQVIKTKFLSFISFFYGFKFKNESVLMDELKLYYSLYDYDTDIRIKKINPFLNFNYNIIYKTGFIGQPLIEDGFITKELYVNQIKEVANKEGGIEYYLHPKERWCKGMILENVNFIPSTMILEERLRKHGIPQKMISFNSSAMLNLRLACPKVEFRYIKFDHPNFHWIDIFFPTNGIQEYSK